MPEPAIAALSSIGRIGFAVKRSHGTNGAVAWASVAAVYASTIAKPPVPSA